MAYANNYGGQQGGYPQQQQMQGPPPQGQPGQPQQGGGGFNPWKPAAGGGGLDEYIFTVKECKPDSNKQDPTKQNLTWTGLNHEQKPATKAWSIGKDWRFDWSSQPPRYVDDRNPQRPVNENTMMGVLLRCITEGVPMDLRNAAQALQTRPGGPLSPAAWVGSRWHMCKTQMDFGQGMREVIFPVAFLGFDNEPMPQVNWRTPNHSSGNGGGFNAQPPAPNGQMQGGGQMQGQGYPQQHQRQGTPPQQQYQQPPAGNMMQQPGYGQQGMPQQQQQYPPQQGQQYPPQGQPGGYPQQQPGQYNQQQQQGYPQQGQGQPGGYQGQFHG